MTKLCPRGKAAAKRKFKVYPSAYANAYASKICAGKIKDPSGVKRKDFRGPKPSKAMGGRVKANGGGMMKEGFTKDQIKKIKDAALKKRSERRSSDPEISRERQKEYEEAAAKLRAPLKRAFEKATGGRIRAAGGGLMEATQRLRAQGLKNGGVARGCGAIMSDRRKKTKIV